MSSQQDSHAAFPLYYDLLLRTLELHRGDYGALYSYALVNKEFHRASSTLLYHLVVLSPPPSELHLLKLGDTGAISSPSNLPSAILPQYASFVLELEISGCLSPRPPPKNTLHSLFSDAISKFTKLKSVKFTPITYHEEVFFNSLSLLPSLSSLGDLSVNSSCLDGQDKIDRLVQLTSLRKLALHSPGRTALQALPAWLESLTSTLTELHLLDNCGSVTPGVLRSIVPHLRERLKAFSLGISYSLTDADVFQVIDQFPALEWLQLRYYYQIKVPTYKPRLRALKHLTVIHMPTTRRIQSDKLCAWIRRVVTTSPLQSLRIVTEGDDNEGVNHDPCPAYDSLINHLVHKHPRTLRCLHLPDGLITVKMLSILFESCTSLESISLSIDNSAMSLVEKKLNNMRNLHTATFIIHNRRRLRKASSEEATRIMMSATQLRRLSIHGMSWEATWECNSPSTDPKLIVVPAKPPIAPWRRKDKS